MSTRREGPRATPRGERVSHVYVLPASTLHFRDRLQFFTPQASGMVNKDITQCVFKMILIQKRLVEAINGSF